MHAARPPIQTDPRSAQVDHMFFIFLFLNIEAFTARQYPTTTHPHPMVRPLSLPLPDSGMTPPQPQPAAQADPRAGVSHGGAARVDRDLDVTPAGQPASCLRGRVLGRELAAHHRAAGGLDGVEGLEGAVGWRG